jgi:hypothetical protein
LRARLRLHCPCRAATDGEAMQSGVGADSGQRARPGVEVAWF